MSISSVLTPPQIVSELPKEGFEGIHTNLSNAVYHALSAFGSSDLKQAARSLAHFKCRVLEGHQQAPSQAFEFGSCSHDMVLEKTATRFLKGPDVSSKATKEWKSFVQNAEPGKVCLTHDEYLRVFGLYRAFESHKLAPRMVEQAQVEQSLFAIDQETGLWLKARPDGYFVEDDGLVIFDYKTTLSARPMDFSRSIAAYGYDLSAAHYIAIASYVLGLQIKDYYFIAQEKDAPYELIIYRAEPEMLARAEAKRRALLNSIKVAIDTNEWPGYTTEIQPIDIPAWAKAQGDDFSGGFE